MTIQNTSVESNHIGNGASTVFAYGFKAYDEAHVKVEINGVVQSTSSYTVSGVGNDSGGSVTLNSAPAAGAEIRVYRDTPRIQQTDYQAYGRFPAETHERRLDYLTSMIQEIFDDALFSSGKNGRKWRKDQDANGYDLINVGRITVQGIGNIVDYINDADADIVNYVNTQDTNVLNAAKAYADAEDADTLAAAKAYADQQDQIFSEADRAYTDSRDASVLAQANAYAASLAYPELGGLFNLSTEEIVQLDSSNIPVGTSTETLSYYADGRGIGARWTKTADMDTPSQTPFDYVDAKLTDASGFVWVISLNPAHVISARQLGSFNDMTNLDDVPIQACINYLAPIGGGVVRMDHPLWLMEGVEILDDGIYIAGLGRYSTNVLYVGDPATSNTVAAFSWGQSKTGSGTLIPVKGCGLKGMTIDCNRSGGSVGSGVRVTVFEGMFFDDVEIKDCFGNYGFGIVGTGSSPRRGIYLRNCAAFRCGADGLDIKAGLLTCVIENFESAGHADETGGDSVGLDVRGQYIHIINPEVYDCPEFGLRIRINAGIEDGDGNWDTTESARVNVINPVCYGNRDNITLNASPKSVVNCINLASRLATRYGIAVGGQGTVNLIGGSATECLSGLLADVETKINVVEFSADRNTQDGVIGGAAKNLKIRGGSISENGRYGLSQAATASGAVWDIDGTTIRGNLTNFALLDAAAAGLMQFRGVVNRDATSRGIQMANAPARFVFDGGDISGNATNVHSLNSNTVFRYVNGIVTKSKGSVSFAVDVATVVTVVVTHGLGFTPSAADFSFSMSRNTNVNDYEIGFIRVAGISSTVANVEIDIRLASASSGALANLLWKAETKDV